VIVLAGSGPTAMAMSTAALDPSVDERVHRIAASPLVRIVPIIACFRDGDGDPQGAAQPEAWRMTSSARGGLSSNFASMAATEIPSFAG
jgi:hypothetical protein